jgi:RecB family endonuclease NucS
LFVVIELKKGQSGDRVVGQIARYLTWVIRRLAGGRARRVRGIIVGREFDKRFAAAIAQLKHVSSYTFDLKILFERWPAERERGA